MPVILPAQLQDQWLYPIRDDMDKQQLNELLTAFPENELQAYTVGRLRGKEYRGNIPEISNEVVYGELDF